jgi:uroporphyrin-3 C-methyltransferase
MTNKNKTPKTGSEETQDIIAPNDAAPSTPESSTKAEPSANADPSAAPPLKPTASKTATSESTPLETAEKNGKRAVKLGTIAIVISIILSGGAIGYVQKITSDYQSQLALLQNQLNKTTTQVDNTVMATEQKTNALLTEITHKTDVQLTQQQTSIESLQMALADIKGRRPNDWLLAESDYLTKLAGRKLFLEHDVVTATHLMESADLRIAALNDPSLMPLRKAIANDITKLKSVPLIDRDGLVLRLSALEQQIDTLPLANAILPDAKPIESQEVSQNINDWQHNLMASLKSFSEQFITFRTRDGNVVPLLSPEQHFYLRENLKAKLETAIKSVYVEQQELYTTALNTAKQWSATYLSSTDNGVKQFNNALESLSKATVEVTYPVKLESQSLLTDVISQRLRREVTSAIAEEQ